MYKTLGFKWLNEASCPASAFVTADRDEARKPPLRQAAKRNRLDLTTKNIEIINSTTFILDN